MAKRLGRLGAGAIPVVVGMLCGEIPPPIVEEGTWDQPIHPLALQNREQVLFASLRQFRSADVVEHLRGHASQSSYDVRLVCARLLGEVATVEAQAALLETLEQYSAAELEREYARSTLEAALAACVQRDPAALNALAKRLQKINPALLPLIARSLGRNRGPQCAQVLAKLLGRSAELDAIAMTELARVSEASGLDLSAGALADVRRLLSREEIQVQRTAITVLGRAGDRDSFDALLTRLAASERLVQVAAHWSLRTLAGVDLGLDVEAWINWRDEQERWWVERHDIVREQLQSKDSAVLFSTIRELSERSYFRQEIARDLGPLACDEQLSVALPAIAALERLGSPRAGPWLVRALEIDEQRRAPAGKALRALSGWVLPDEQAAWTRALEGFAAP
jgi:HEAT repeat protein